MRRSFKRVTFFCLLTASGFIFNASVQAEKPAKIIFISGKPSHGRMKHEHRAGNMILADALDRSHAVRALFDIRCARRAVQVYTTRERILAKNILELVR